MPALLQHFDSRRMQQKHNFVHLCMTRRVLHGVEIGYVDRSLDRGTLNQTVCAAM